MAIRRISSIAVSNILEEISILSDTTGSLLLARNKFSAENSVLKGIAG